jgi:hypothetical protein
VAEWSMRSGRSEQRHVIVDNPSRQQPLILAELARSVPQLSGELFA